MVKERWSNDPNGEVWARDETKVGQKMMESMGWTSGKGLGAAEQGSTTHVKVNKRAQQLGLGADSNTPDKWAEHISDFDGILSRLNASAPSSAPSSAPNSAPVSDIEQEQPATKRRKKSKNLYTKFKKNKNLSSLSEKDMAHIFGESTVKGAPTSTPPQDTPPQPEPDMTGVKTVTSSMSLADYFNSKKLKLAQKQALEKVAAHPSRASSLTNDWHRKSALVDENSICEEGEEKSSFKFEFSVESEESKKKKEIRKEIESDFKEKKKKQKKKKSKHPHLKEVQRELPEKWD